MTSSPLHTVPRDRLLRLVEDYEFKPYRHYRTHTRKEQAAILAAEIDEALAAGSFGQWVTRDGEDAAVVGARAAVGLAVLRRGDGPPRLRARRSGARPSSISRPPSAARIAAARAEGLQHLAARVDVADLRTMGVLEARRLPHDGRAGHLHHAAAQGPASRRAGRRHDPRRDAARTPRRSSPSPRRGTAAIAAASTSIRTCRRPAPTPSTSNGRGPAPTARWPTR